MPKERADYRTNITNIKETFPNVGALTIEQTAKWLSVDRRTVKSLIQRRYNPLPAVDIGGGKNKVYRIPIEALARFIS